MSGAVAVFMSGAVTVFYVGSSDCFMSGADVQPSFQLLLPQTWAKCTLWDSSRCVVYAGIRFKVILAASKKIRA